MSVIVIDTTEDAALDLLAAVARQAGPLAELGRPVLAVGGYGVVTDLGEATGYLRVESDGTASRTVELPTGLYEITRWRGGVEVSRVAAEPAR